MDATAFTALGSYTMLLSTTGLVELATVFAVAVTVTLFTITGSVVDAIVDAVAVTVISSSITVGSLVELTDMASAGSYVMEP